MTFCVSILNRTAQYCISDSDLGKYGCADETARRYRRPPNTYQSSDQQFYSDDKKNSERFTEVRVSFDSW